MGRECSGRARVPGHGQEEEVQGNGVRERSGARKEPVVGDRDKLARLSERGYKTVAQRVACQRRLHRYDDDLAARGQYCASYLEMRRSDLSAKEFYDRYHRRARTHPIERLKEARRVETLGRLMPGEAGSLLVVGCGRGEELAIARGVVTAIDLSLTALLVTRFRPDRARLLQADACRLPFGDRSFDTVVCSEVIEHVVAAEAAVAEIARVLRPGGRLVLSTPNTWSFFGLARAIGEAVTGRQITSGGQPYDRWRSPRELQELLRARFDMTRTAGVWFFPPFGRGERQLWSGFTVPLVRLLGPTERLLGRYLPWFGHLIVVKADRRLMQDEQT